MRPWMNKLDAGYRRVETAFAVLSGAVILAIMILITTDVFLRHFFNSPLPGTYELTTLLFVPVVYLGVSYVQANKGHIFIEIGGNKLSPKTIKIMDFIANVAGLVIVSIIAWRTGLDFWKAYESKNFTMGIVQFPYWPSKLALTFGLILLFFRLLLDIFDALVPGDRPKLKIKEDQQHAI